MSQIEKSPTAIRHMPDLSLVSANPVLAAAKAQAGAVAGNTQEYMLNNICESVEGLIPGVVTSILLLNTDDNKLYLGAGPSLNQIQREAFDGFSVGPESASCGTAVYTGEKVIVENTQTDPRWDQYRDFARDNAMLACWSIPFRGRDDQVLGAFAISHPSPASPTEADLRVLELCGSLASHCLEQKRSEQELKQVHRIVDESKDLMIAVGTDLVILEANRAYAEYRGYGQQKIIGLPLRGVLEPEYFDTRVEPRLQSCFDGETLEFEEWSQFPSSGRRYMRFRLTPYYEEDRILGAVVVIQDLTALQQTKEALSETEALFAKAFETSPDMMLIQNEQGEIERANLRFTETTGYPRHEIEGARADNLHLDPADALVIEESLRNNGFVSNFETRVKCKDGRIVPAILSSHSIMLNERRCLFSIVRDISESKKMQARLEYLATHDSLTGLVNRYEFENRLEALLARDEQEPCHALCYLDLDQFKVINDTCGHLAGDELLRQLSQVFKTLVRRKDTLARLGGDEFGVLLEDCPLPAAGRLAANLLAAVEEFRFCWEDKRFNLSVSIGLVPIDRRVDSISDILSAADSACYAAKDAGRDRVHLFHLEDEDLSKRRGEMQWVAEINGAMEEDRLCLAAQPIMSLADSGDANPGKHYEILLRMKSLDGEVIPPGAFLPAAERYNMSVILDRWVVTTTLGWLAANPQELEQLGVCAINLSGLSLGDEVFLGDLLQCFRQTGVPPQKICFEITETAAVANLSTAIDFIGALKNIGCLIALDDFGTGLSSFSYLKNLPVDFLKIDGSFVRDMLDDPIDYAMVRSINEIGQVMGKKTIAEFVESEQIAEALRKMGVDYAQGYAIGAPQAWRESSD